MRDVAEALAADGHDVTYLTRRQWDPADAPRIPGVRVVAVSRAEPLYGPDGNRTIGEPLRFGWGVLKHLARHGRDYDVVHTASFPYFSLLAAGAARRPGRYRIVADWHEVWSASYWAEYLGGVQGRVARQIQRACARVRQHAFCFSELHARRLREEGLRGTPTVLRGEYAGPTEGLARREPEPLVVFAGRMIPEKQAPAVVGAVVAARKRVPELRAGLFGDRPQLGGGRSSPAPARSWATSGGRSRATTQARSSAHPASWTPRRSRTACRAPPASCCRRCGRATARSSWRPPRTACRACWWPRPTTPR